MKVLTGGYNEYKYDIYENSRTENLVDLTLNNDLETVLMKIKNHILAYYNKKIRYRETETTKLSIAKYQGIARYNILLKK